ncbi:MAG TPA: hypothetical protein PK690_13285 [Emcibacteraceae bacterium]|nr:hypothetical protein [Emcibacteraceae bacterium]
MDKKTLGGRKDRLSFEDWKARILRDQRIFPEVRVFPPLSQNSDHKQQKNRAPFAPFFVGGSNSANSNQIKETGNGPKRGNEAAAADKYSPDNAA